MISRLSFAIFLLCIATFASANKLEAHKVNSNLSPAVVESVPGQWTLVQLWALDCAVCEEQKPALSQMNKEYKELTVLGLSLDGLSNVENVKKRLASKLTSFDNFIAELGSVKSQLQSLFSSEYIGTPTYILYSPKGKIVTVQPGPIDLLSLPKQLSLTKAEQALPSDLIQ